MNRALRRAAPWLISPGLLLLLYWPGLRAWFQTDDFAWLSLWRNVYDWRSLLHVLFAPMAQGTVRPWSERVFFLLFHEWFGFDAFPWRLFVFANACACLVFIGLIARRITPATARWREFAIWIAPASWLVSSGLPIPMTWTSDYNQIQCALFLLVAFYLRLRGVYWAELLVFVLGFGALEINVVYPALALGWVLLSPERERWRRWVGELAPMFLISAVYAIVHRHFAPPLRSGPYAMHFDRSILDTFGTYWQWAMLGPHWFQMPGHPEKLGLLAVVLFSAALAFFVLRCGRAAIFGVYWFAITLAPLLPLRDHVSIYYLTVPALGIAFAMGAGIVQLAKGASLPRRAFAAVLLGLFLAMNASASHSVCRWYEERSLRVRTLVLGVATAHEKHPGQAILLDGVDEDVINAALANSPFKALGIPKVYLSPQTSAHLDDQDEAVVLPLEPTARALAESAMQVYRLDGNRLQNITGLYESSLRNLKEINPPERVDIGNPMMGYLLGSEWYALEGEHRWMPRRATVRLGGPSENQGHLALIGYCPEGLIQSDPLRLTVAVDGKPLPSVEITKPEFRFVRSLDVPASVRGRKSVLVSLEVSRTARMGNDPRELGLAFGTVEFVP